MKILVINDNKVYEVPLMEVNSQCDNLFLLNFQISKMSKANFSIAETGGSGSVKLQSSTNGTTWVDVGDPIALTNGMKTVTDDDNLTLDSEIYPVGETFFFRLVDGSGTPTSNVVQYTIPGIMDYAAGTALIDFTSAAGDNWTIGYHIAPLTLQTVSDGVTVVSFTAQASFYPTGASDIDIAEGNVQDSTADYTGTTSGNGAGIYLIQVAYMLSNGLKFGVARVVKVDDSGNIIAELYCKGTTINSVDGLNINVSAVLEQTGDLPILWGALSGGDIQSLGEGSPIDITLPSNTNVIIYTLPVDTDPELAEMTHDFFLKTEVLLT